MGWTLLRGDCLEVMRDLPADHFHAIVTDPPYGLGFMGREWDFLPPGREWAEACLRVARPGAHLLAFGGTRTHHRLACAIEDAGWEIRDTLMWLYGSGFPKSHDVSKAIDKQRGDGPAWRGVGQWLKSHREAAGYRTRGELAPMILDGHKNLDSAAANLSNWENGLSLPTWERWLALKSLLSLPDDMDAEVWRLNGRKGAPGEAWDQRERVGSKRAGVAVPGEAPRYTIGGSRSVEVDVTAPATEAARQWDGWGTALKPAHEPIIVARKPLTGTVASNVQEWGCGALNVDECRIGSDTSRGDHYNGQGPGGGGGPVAFSGKREQSWNVPAGRWPANVVLDEEAAAMLDAQTGTLTTQATRTSSGDGQARGVLGWPHGSPHNPAYLGESGGPSRFFYTAKASRADRGPGNHHPTVKPTDLMQWLVRLVTPRGGHVLDPFAGSGSTGVAAVREGCDVTLIEREDEYADIAERRLATAHIVPPTARPDEPIEGQTTLDLGGVA